MADDRTPPPPDRQDTPTCGEPGDFRGYFRCGKPANHYGERHHADFELGTYTWGYVPEIEEANRG